MGEIEKNPLDFLLADSSSDDEDYKNMVQTHKDVKSEQPSIIEQPQQVESSSQIKSGTVSGQRLEEPLIKTTEESKIKLSYTDS